MSRFEERLARLFSGAGQQDNDYPKDLASWQIERGLNGIDMTPEQSGRFRAFEMAGGSVPTAKRLTFGRLRFRSGRLSDGR